MVERIEGQRGVARALGRSRGWVTKRAHRKHDPIPLREYRHRQWIRRDTLVAWYERDERRERLTKTGNHTAPTEGATHGKPQIADRLRMSARCLDNALREPEPPPVEIDADGHAWAYDDALVDYVETHTRRAKAPVVPMRTARPRRWIQAAEGERKPAAAKGQTKRETGRSALAGTPRKT